MNEDFEIFDWARILLNNWKPSFLLEVIFRTFIMFLAVLTLLRLAGKRGLRQLSIFELAIIIALGSAAGDPMLYPDTPILPAILNFILVIAFYKILTWLAGRSTKIEDLIEGKPICILEKGKINRSQLEIIGYDEFLSELRTQHISHLGQVEKIYQETSGELSIYFVDEKDVVPGLPIQPEYYNKGSQTCLVSALHSCVSCGNTLPLEKGDKQICSNCQGEIWLPSIDGKRIS